MEDEVLGFNKENAGLHSIRLGGAMAMFLSGTLVVRIQRVERWSSEAFLEYIREQVETFTLDVSKNMLKFEEFFNLNSNIHQESYTLIDTGNNLLDIENEDAWIRFPSALNSTNWHCKGEEIQNEGGGWLICSDA